MSRSECPSAKCALVIRRMVPPNGMNGRTGNGKGHTRSRPVCPWSVTAHSSICLLRRLRGSQHVADVAYDDLTPVERAQTRLDRFAITDDHEREVVRIHVLPRHPLDVRLGDRPYALDGGVIEVERNAVRDQRQHLAGDAARG